MKKLLLALALFFAPSVAWAQCNGVFGANSVCGSVLGGPPQTLPLSTTTFTFGGNNTFSGNNTFAGNTTFNGATTFTSTNTFTNVSTFPAGTLGAGMAFTQAMSGSATLFNWNTFTTTSDTEQCAFCVDIYVKHTYGGATARGSRSSIFGWSLQTSANSGSGTTAGVGVEGQGQTNSGDGGTGTGNTTAKGTYFGGNFIGASSAANVYEVIGAEFDTQTTSASSARYAFGISAVNIESVQAAAADAAVVVYSGGPVAAAGGGGPWGPGVGFHNGILFAELAGNGLVPIDSGGSVLSTHLESLANIPVTNGVDLRGFAVSGLSYASSGFSVNGSGNMIVAGAVNRSHAMDIGPDNGTNVVQINGGNAPNTGAILLICETGTCLGSIGYPSAILGGAFDFNLGISGFSGLKFYTNNTLAWSIDTSANLNGISGSVITWNADTGISRDSAGVIDVGNGTAKDKSGTINTATVSLSSLVAWNSDTGISRDSAAVIDFGNGTAANSSATLQMSSFTISGTPKFNVFTTGAGTQTFTNSPCSALTTERWIKVTFAGSTSQFFIPSCS